MNDTTDQAFRTLVRAAYMWAQRMDQWEKIKFDTDYGPIYVTISMQSQYPDSFDHVDPETGDVIAQAGIGKAVSNPDFYRWKGEGPEPERWEAPDGTIVFRDEYTDNPFPHPWGQQ